MLSKASSIDEDVLKAIKSGSGHFPDLSPIDATEILNLAARGGNDPYPYYTLAKINYKSPCDMNGVKFRIELGDAVPICFFGKLNDASGSATSGAASGNLIGSYRSDVNISEQQVAFYPATLGAVAPKSQASALFCWVLLGCGSKRSQQSTGDGQKGDNDYSHGYGYGSGTTDCLP